MIGHRLLNFSFCYCLLLIVVVVEGAKINLGDDENLKSLMALLPFTLSNQPINYLPTQLFDINNDDSNIGNPMVVMNPTNINITMASSFPLGVSYLAAALMAVEHFNSRNPIVVPELQAIMNKGCLSKLSFVGIANSQGMGTSSVSHLLEWIHNQSLPDAILTGPFIREEPTFQLATMLREPWTRPFISSSGSDLQVVSAYSGSLATRTSPSVFGLAQATVQYLLHKQRSDFIAILHAVYPISVQQQEALYQECKAQDIPHVLSADYAPPFYFDIVRPVRDALEQIVQSGYRTIVVVVHDFATEIPLLAQTAKELNMFHPTNDDDDDNAHNSLYTWVLVGDFNVEHVVNWSTITHVDPTLVMEFLIGVAMIQPIDNFLTSTTNPSQSDNFFKAWRQFTNNQTLELFRDNLLLLKNPIPELYDVPQDYFDTVQPALGSGFVYDSIMALGLAFCKHDENPANATTSNINDEKSHANDNEFYKQIIQTLQQVDFTGATGHVRFDYASSAYPGTRSANSVSYGVYNVIRSSNMDDDVDLSSIQCILTDILPGIPKPSDSTLDQETKSQGWESIRPFIYSDGGTETPMLLRVIEENNYLTRGSRLWGFILFSVSIILSIMVQIWIFWQRNNQVIKASQPLFLYLVALGSTFFACSILVNSFDESYGWSVQMLSRACTSSPWFIILGFMTIYSGLWCKLWRIHKVLQFASRRRTITTQSIIGPAAALFALVFIILTIWTILEGFEWKREEINPITGETAGSCRGIHTRAYFTPLFLLMLIPPFLTACLAWQTRDVDSRYAESKWIFIMIMVQFQLVFISIPLLMLVDGLSTNARYIGQSTVFCLFCVMTLGLIFGPKIYKVHLEPSIPKQPKRGASSGGTVHVSGVSVTTNHGYANSGVSSFTTAGSIVPRNNSKSHSFQGSTNCQPQTTNYNVTPMDDNVIRNKHDSSMGLKVPQRSISYPDPNNASSSMLLPAIPEKDNSSRSHVMATAAATTKTGSNCGSEDSSQPSHTQMTSEEGSSSDGQYLSTKSLQDSLPSSAAYTTYDTTNNNNNNHNSLAINHHHEYASSESSRMSSDMTHIQRAFR